MRLLDDVEHLLLAVALRRVRGHIARADAPSLDELALAVDVALLALRTSRGRRAWWAIACAALAAGVVIGRLSRPGASGPRPPR